MLARLGRLMSKAGVGGVLYTEGTDITTFNANAGWTVLNRTFAVDNGATISSIGAYALSPMTIVVKLALRVSAGNYTVVVSKSYSHLGSGWEDCVLDSSYQVPDVGDYYAGHFSATARPAFAVQARSVKNSDAVGTTTISEDTGNSCCVRVTGTKPF